MLSTGGMTNVIDLKFEMANDMKLWDSLNSILSEKDCTILMGVSSKDGTDNEQGADANQGIVQGHAYALLRLLTLDHGRVKLVQIKNPWHRKEWSGGWSDESPLWTESLKKELCTILKKDSFQPEDDGVFFMSYEDLCKHWESIEIIRLFETLDQDGVFSTNWTRKAIHGEFKEGFDGGEPYNNNSYAGNHQYALTLDRDSEFFISLDIPTKRIGGVEEQIATGFTIYAGDKKVTRETPVVYDAVHTYSRYTKQEAPIKLAKGSYVIIPSTFDPKQHSPFTLRIMGRDKVGIRLKELVSNGGKAARDIPLVQVTYNTGNVFPVCTDEEETVDPEPVVVTQPVKAVSKPVTKVTTKTVVAKKVTTRPVVQPVVKEDMTIVKYGDYIKIKHWTTNHVLHSHSLNYSGGSGQQQVTGFIGRNNDDWWQILSATGKTGAVSHNDTIRLMHSSTKNYLHSHSGIASPVSGQQEVTCFNGMDTNNDWTLLATQTGVVHAGLNVYWFLTHVNTGFKLHSHPHYFDLGNGTDTQQEITCFNGHDDNNYWQCIEIYNKHKAE
jgi:hypothetical protein